MGNYIQATGHAFNLRQLYQKFPLKKLKINCKQCKELIGTEHREQLISNIFIECYKTILNDVINNNVAFSLPTGNRKSEITVQRVIEEAFKNLRRAGKWRDVDFLTSNFTGYQVILKMYHPKRPTREKIIYTTKELKDQLTNYTNTGLSPLAKTVKTINDYYDIIQSKFSKVCIEDIKRILNYGFKQLYLLNSYGGDVVITDNNGFWSYIGKLFKDSLKYYYYYSRKLALKLRILYRRLRINWDGYYYFGLTESEYQKYLEQQHKRGRKRKYFTFNKIYLYQILDECRIKETMKKYIFRIPYLTYISFKFYLPELKTDKAELIITREPPKFKDILINDNEFQFL